MYWQSADGRVTALDKMTTPHLEASAHLIVSKRGMWRRHFIFAILQELRRRKLDPFGSFPGPRPKR